MPSNVDTRSKNILNYRPSIEYVEPKQQEVVPTPLSELKTPSLPQTDKLENLAATIDVLGAAVQAQIDQAAKDVAIKLDPAIDAAAIQAILRMFPEKSTDTTLYITYQDFKDCQDLIASHAADLAKQASISPEDIANARKNIDTVVPGGYGTPASTDGGLRPELSTKAQIVQPINMSDFQNDLIKILMNYLWKSFIRPPLAKIPFASSVLPKDLPKLSKKQNATLNNAKAKGASVLG
jgi:hypothetical protein